MKKAPRIPRSHAAPPTPSWWRRHAGRSGREWYVVGLGLVVAFAIAVPLAIVLDRHSDRTKPMYDDVVSMEALQYQLVQKGKPAKPMVVEPGESVRLVGTRFTPSAGVTIEVRLEGDDYCVRGTNRFGDVSDWSCGDGSTNPAPYG